MFDLVEELSTREVPLSEVESLRSLHFAFDNFPIRSLERDLLTRETRKRRTQDTFSFWLDFLLSFFLFLEGFEAFLELFCFASVGIVDLGLLARDIVLIAREHCLTHTRK